MNNEEKLPKDYTPGNYITLVELSARPLGFLKTLRVFYQSILTKTKSPGSKKELYSQIEGAVNAVSRT